MTEPTASRRIQLDASSTLIRRYLYRKPKYPIDPIINMEVNIRDISIPPTTILYEGPLYYP